jgi:heterodisulfide reductase subunit C
VVAAAAAGETELDITPQQVMNLLRLGHRDLALESRMVWECVTCYQCQELCPQGIAVADILYALRNDAWSRRSSRPVDHKPA